MGASGPEAVDARALTRPWIDISRPLRSELPVWPGAESFSLRKTKDFSKDGVDEHHLSMNIHTGTHWDAPSHFVGGGKTADQMPLEPFLGPCAVFELEGEGHWTPEILDRNLDSNATRVLLKSRNSGRSENDFDPGFAALSPEAAAFLAEKKIRLVGVDGPSVQRFSDADNTTHETLLKKEIVILEGLDLSAVSPGRYELLALPLLIPGAEGAPVRALLRKADA